MIIKPERSEGVVYQGPNPEEILFLDANGLLYGWTNLGETFRD